MSELSIGTVRARSFSLPLAYGMAHFGKSLIWYASELLLAYFLTEIAGFTAERMALILAAGLLLSALLDRLAGALIQKWLATPELAARLQLRGSLASAIALTAFFALAMVPEPYRLALALLASIGFRIAFTLYDLPQNALMALMPRNEDERLRMGGMRVWFSGLATLTVALTVGPFIAGRDDPVPAAMLLIGTAFCLVALSGAAWLSARVSATAPTMIVERATGSADPASLFWRWMVIAVATTAFTPAFAKLEPYFATYAIGSAWWGGAIITAMASGIALGQPLWLTLSSRYSPGYLLCASAAVQAASLVLFGLTSALYPAILALAAFGFGVGSGGVGVQLWTGVGQAVAGRGVRTGRAYGSFGAIAKLGMAAGSVMIAGVVGQGTVPGQGVWFQTGMTALPGIGVLLALMVGRSLINRAR